MKIFISGGAKNGKSYYAQKRAKDLADSQNLPLYYVATMIPHDGEDEARIARHLKEREGWGFETLEKPFGLSDLVDDSCQADLRGVFLVDSVTAILSNAMFPAEYVQASSEEDEMRAEAIEDISDGIEAGDTGDRAATVSFGYDERAAETVAEDLLNFANRVENVIFVSDYIYAEIDYKERIENDYTEVYRRGLAYVDRKLAEACDEVIEITAGISINHKK